MALENKMILPNGVEINYHVISLIEVTKQSIKVVLNGFKSKEYYDKAMTKINLQLEQKKLSIDFYTLNSKEKLTKSQESKRIELMNKINDLANQINDSLEYSQYVLGEYTLELSPIDNFSISSIENQILKQDKFKLSKIVK